MKGQTEALRAQAKACTGTGLLPATPQAWRLLVYDGISDAQRSHISRWYFGNRNISQLATQNLVASLGC